MLRTAFALGIVVVALLAAPAEARFGKKNSHSGSSTDTSESSSQSSEHAAVPVGSSPTSSSSSAFSGAVRSGNRNAFRPSWRRGYFSGAYVPWYGYGYWVRPLSSCEAPSQVDLRRDVEPEDDGWRLAAHVELLMLLGTERGFTAGLHAAAEADVLGLTILAQNIAAVSKEEPGFDHLQQLALHGTVAFLTGRYGRLRAELGLDVIVAPDAVFLGPTGGVSGTLWLGGPVALEGSALLTPIPFRQVDARAAVAVGFGPWGLKAGVRLQLLDDRGVVDGVTHRDIFWGPYLSVGLVL